LLLATEDKAAAMEPETTVSRHMEQTEHTPASDIQVAAAENPKLSSSNDTSYAIIIKYDNGYVKSNDGILRLLHIVSCFDNA